MLTHKLCEVITGRNEVLAKVMFLQVSVILLTGGEYLTRYTPLPLSSQVHPPGRYTPWAGTPPGRYTPLGRYTPRAGTHPPGQVHPPGRYTPWAGTPPLAGTPPWAGTPPLWQVHPPGRYTPLAGTSPLWQVHTPPLPRNTVNDRPVRILLECILVSRCLPMLALEIRGTIRKLHFSLI